jgi:putative addiction module antidote
MTTALVTESGVLLSQDILAQIGARTGDELQVIAADGCISLKKLNASVEEQVEVAKRVMDKRRDVLRRLAE